MNNSDLTSFNKFIIVLMLLLVIFMYSYIYMKNYKAKKRI